VVVVTEVVVVAVIVTELVVVVVTEVVVAVSEVVVVTEVVVLVVTEVVVVVVVVVVEGEVIGTFQFIKGCFLLLCRKRLPFIPYSLIYTSLGRYLFFTHTCRLSRNAATV
jgi:hypothetical protein